MDLGNIILSSIDKEELKHLIQSAIKEEIGNHNELAGGNEMEELLTREEVAEIYRTSLVTLRQWEKDGIIPKPIRKGSRVLFRKSDIMKDIQGKAEPNQ